MERLRLAYDRALRAALTLLFALLLVYALYSTPQLIGRWGPSAGGLLVLAAWAGLVAWALATIVRLPGKVEWIAFAAVAIALRLASAWLAAPRVSPGDSHWYIVIAQNLLAGRGLVVDEPFMGVACRALFPPFYGILLAGWGSIAGFTTPSLLLLSTAIDLGAAWLIVAIGGVLGARRAGVAAALLYLVWPSTLFSAPLAQKEGLCVLLALALAYGWLRAAAREKSAGHRLRDAAIIGVPAALLALTQPGESLLALLFGLVLLPWIGVRRVLMIGVPAAALALAMMLPWWARNWLVFHQFVPLTTAAGLSLWVGNNPDATGNWLPYPQSLQGLGEIAYAKAAGDLAWQWIVQHPADFVHLTIAKFLRATAIGEFGVSRLAAMRPPISAAVGALLFPLSHGAHVMLLAAGALALRTRRDPAIILSGALLFACVVQLGLFGVWFEFGERHREFMTPFLLIAVSLAVARVAAHRAAAQGNTVLAPS